MKTKLLYLSLVSLLVTACGGNHSKQITSIENSSDFSISQTSESSSSSISSNSSISKQSSSSAINSNSSASSQQTSSVSSSSSIASQDEFTTKTINVYYPNATYNTTVQVRFYNKSVIPYISIKEFNALLYRGREFKQGRDRFDLVKNGDVYTCTVSGGYTATFNTLLNNMESPDLWGFKNTNYKEEGEKALVSFDGLPFVRVKGLNYDTPIQSTSINFDSYNFEIYGDNNALYIPLVFAADLFSNENILQAAYNGKDLYISNETENESIADFGGKYFEDMYSTPISQEYASLYYYEMCLDYDYFMGRPGRSSLERYYDLSNGLDAALESRPYGRLVKSYLKSTDLGEMISGASLFGYLREDGGHSFYHPYASCTYVDNHGETRYPSWLTETIYNQVQSTVVNVYYSGQYEELKNYDRGTSYRGSLYKARRTKLGKNEGPIKGTDTYTKDGDIAYIHIDGFMGEIELRDEWDRYYKGEISSIPFGKGKGGAVGAIYNGVLQASQDKDIKHLVVDLGANTGGSTDEMLFMINLLCGSDKFYTYNTQTKNYRTTTYEFDLNFDRVFDEKDNEVRNLLKDLDITVLTTKNGFSCGGISPIYLHDEGLFTIGEDCGGGSCSVYEQYDAYGNLNRSSSPSHTVNKNRISVDVGRTSVCDSTLIFPKLGDGLDYSSLYDTATLKSLIEQHYNVQ